MKKESNHIKGYGDHSSSSTTDPSVFWFGDIQYHFADLHI